MSADSVVSASASSERRTATPYRRILLKISGESLAGEQGYGLSPEVVARVAQEIEELVQAEIEVAIVVGGGNIFRGLRAATEAGMDRATADYMGMLATVINALALQDALERRGVWTRVQTAIEMREVAEPFIQRRAMRHLEKRRVVIFAAGTGSPFFTTDTAAALRATQIEADVLLKATDVEGVFDRNPQEDPENATLFREIEYLEVLKQGYRVMDLPAIALSRDNNIPIIVFNMDTPGNIRRAAFGEPIGTRVQ